MVLDWAFALPVPLGVHAQGRRRAGEPPQRGAAARAGRAGDGLPGGRQGDRQAVLRALPPAALRPRRLRRGGAADRRADRPGRRRRLRGDLPEARRRPSRWRGRSARRSSRSRRPSRGSGRWDWSRCPSKWRIEFCEPIDLSEHGPEAADDRRLVFEISEQVRETIQASSTRTWSSGARRSSVPCSDRLQRDGDGDPDSQVTRRRRASFEHLLDDVLTETDADDHAGPLLRAAGLRIRFEFPDLAAGAQPRRERGGQTIT